MSISLLYNDEKEHIRHLNAIRLLQREAAGHGVDEHVVRLLYEAELAELKATSRITTFLSVLTMRRVREVFRYVEYVHNGSNPTIAMEKSLTCPYSRALVGVLPILLTHDAIQSSGSRIANSLQRP